MGYFVGWGVKMGAVFLVGVWCGVKVCLIILWWNLGVMGLKLKVMKSIIFNTKISLNSDLSINWDLVILFYNCNNGLILICYKKII